MSVSSVSGAQNFLTPANVVMGRQDLPNPTRAAAAPERADPAASANYRFITDCVKDRARAQVMTEKNMSPETLNTMGSERRVHAEKEIGRLVNERLQEMMQRKVQDAAAAGQMQGALLNIRA